jgi:hypothetical protein
LSGCEAEWADQPDPAEENVDKGNLRKLWKWRGFFDDRKGNRSREEVERAKWNLVEWVELRAFLSGIGWDGALGELRSVWDRIGYCRRFR